MPEHTEALPLSDVERAILRSSATLGWILWLGLFVMIGTVIALAKSQHALIGAFVFVGYFVLLMVWIVRLRCPRCKHRFALNIAKNARSEHCASCGVHLDPRASGPSTAGKYARNSSSRRSERA